MLPCLHSCALPMLPRVVRICAAVLLTVCSVAAFVMNGTCNADHGMLPVSYAQAKAMGLHSHTCELIRRFSALPALVERYGWPRRLAAPSMMQLGYYPGGTGARYKPHLDRWPNEVNNRRELTFLVYVNVGWDADLVGGHLRLHPEPGSESTVIDVAPTAGRVVIFESGKQLHEVRESTQGADRLALTLWVEYEGDWDGDGAGRLTNTGTLPAIQQ